MGSTVLFLLAPFACAQVTPDTWSAPGEFATVPGGFVALDGDLAHPGSGDFLYMTTIGGEHSQIYFRYSMVTNAWTQMATHPDAQAFHLGTALESNGTDLLYNFIGEFDTFWSYSVSTDTWSFLGNTPAAMAGGADLVYPRAGDFMFALSGGVDFWRYQISTNAWINTIADAPDAQNNGGTLVSPGGDFIYMFRGDNTTDFNRYSIAGDAWTAMTAAPDNVSNGGDLVFPGSGDFIYALRGGTTTDFWRYSISGNAWTTMAATPGANFSGSTLVYPGTGSLIYAIRGDVGEVYRYRFKANEPPNLAAVPLLDQFEPDGVTTIAVGGATGAVEPVFSARINEPERDTWRFEVELRPADTAFSSVATMTSPMVPSGTTASVTPAPLATGGYHWRFRFVDALGDSTPWTSFGGNADGTADLTVGAAAVARKNKSLTEKCTTFAAAQTGAPETVLLLILVTALLGRAFRRA